MPQGAALALSTKEYRWVQEEAWGEAEIIYFYSHWPSPRSAMSLYPAFVRQNHHRQKLVFLGRWILSKADESKVAAVQLEGLFSSFTQVAVRVGPGGEAEGWADSGRREALAHLISALILMYNADIVRLVPETKSVSEQLTALGWGTASSLWSPNLAYLSGGAKQPPAIGFVSRSIDPEDWWSSVDGQRGHRAVSYLEKRISLTKLQEKACERRRPGLFQRLGRLIRWS